MSEQITITISVEQAEALIDAANCMSCAAENDIATLIRIYTPDGIEEAREANRYRLYLAELAQLAAKQLREEVDGAYKRDPGMQDLLHAVKMHRKHGQD